MPPKEKRVRNLTNVDRVRILLGFTKQEALDFCLRVGDDTGATFYMVYEALVKALQLTSRGDITSEYLIKRINDERMETYSKDGRKFSYKPSASIGEAPSNRSIGGHWSEQLRMSPSDSNLKEYREKVVGVTFENRQEVISKIEVGEEVCLRREPENPFDANAISVERMNGNQIGYLSRDLAAILADDIDNKGGVVCANVVEKTGGVPGFDTMGVIVHFSLANLKTVAQATRHTKKGMGLGADDPLPPAFPSVLDMRLPDGRTVRNAVLALGGAQFIVHFVHPIGDTVSHQKFRAGSLEELSSRVTHFYAAARSHKVEITPIKVEIA